MQRPHLRRFSIFGALALGAASLLTAGTATIAAADPKTIDVQLLSINDFHGNLEPPAGSSGRITTTAGPVDAGGVEYLATHLARARQGHANSLTVAAGDLIGASPLLSGAFHDEPTIEAMNLLGLDVTSVGNHEFDEGSTELLRMQDGGCRHNTDGTLAADSCPRGEDSFDGADFPFLSANVVREDTGETLFPPYLIEEVGGAKIGFIGMTLEGTPDIVTAAGVAGLKFLDETATANKYAKELHKQGVKAIVVLLHQGGIPASGVYNYDCNAGGALGLTGPIVDIARSITPKVDLLITGHTHTSYVCDIPDPDGTSRMVTSAASFGRLFTDIELTYNTESRDIVRSSVEAANQIVTRDVPKDSSETELINEYKTFIGPIADRVIGYIGGTILGRGCSFGTTCPASGEEPAGDLIADAQLAGMRADPLNPDGADFAIMNPGGIRADFACEGEPTPCAVTYAEAFAVQPFTNIMNVIQMSGADVLTMFGQQWTTQNAGEQRILQVSSNVAETYDPTRPANTDKLVSLTVDGVPIDPSATYRVAMNEFLGGGGDNFTAIRNGTKVFVGKSDLDVLVDYLTANSSATSPYPVPTADRITLGSS